MIPSAILCVDDEILVLESLEIELYKAFGDAYLYEFAESAEEALEVLEELRDREIAVLVVISDWLMPGMKGDEFLIRVHQILPRVVTVMLTGQADDYAVEHARHQANLFECIRKPWNGQELITKIREALAIHGH